MFNRLNFKIYTVTIISLAFLFRLLSLYLGFTPVSSASQSIKHRAPQHLSVLEKNNTITEASIDKSSVQFNSPVEVCEESLDSEDDLSKLVAVFFLPGFHSSLKHLVFTPKLNASFDSIKCDICPKKYLALSVLRV